MKPLHRKNSRKNSRGFTLLEVMMALTVLAIGMLGIVALQAATVASTTDAQLFTIANAITRTWVNRLQTDAQRWNHPSPNVGSEDLGGTAWLGYVTANADAWVRPGKTPLEPMAMPSFDLNGLDVDLDDANAQRDRVVFCSHLRLRRIYGTAVAMNGLVRAEVRVFWRKRRLGNPTAFGGYGLWNGICTVAGNENALGADRDNFHWAYAVSAVTKARAMP